jgi:hypothetical protein
MPDELARQSIIDEEHLKLLSLGYMISAATTAFFSLFALMYMAMGIFMGTFVSHQDGTGSGTNQTPPAFVGWFIGAIGLGVFLFLAILAGVKLRTAFCIKRRRSRTFCLIVAGISCLAIPYGTVLGALSFIVLGRDSVARLFNPSVSPSSST